MIVYLNTFPRCYERGSATNDTGSYSSHLLKVRFHGYDAMAVAADITRLT